MRIAVLILGLLLPASDAFAEAAIAVGRSPNGGWAYGTAWNYPTIEEATAHALARCNAGAYDCVIDNQFHKTCFGIARSRRGGLLMRSGDTNSGASKAALSACRRELGAPCRISDVICDTVSEAEIAAEKSRRHKEYERFTWHWSACFDKELVHACSEALAFSNLSAGDRDRLNGQRAHLEDRVRDKLIATPAIVDVGLTTGSIPAAAGTPAAAVADIAALWSSASPEARSIIGAASAVAVGLLVLFLATLRQPSAVTASTGTIPSSRALTSANQTPLVPARADAYQTAAAIAALELAHAYMREFHDDHSDAITDPMTARAILETLALATKQITIAERNDRLATITVTNKDGSPLVIDLVFLKSHALFYESLCHWADHPRRAIRCLEQALALAPNSPNALFTLGLIHHSQLNKSAAIAAFQQAVALDPGNLDYRKALDRAQNISGASIVLDRTFAAGRSTANAGRWMFTITILGTLVFCLVYYPMGVLGVIVLGIGGIIHDKLTQSS